MKPISIIGVLLIIAGIAALVLGEVSFTKRETVVQLGDAKIEAQTQGHLSHPRHRRRSPRSSPAWCWWSSATGGAERFMPAAMRHAGCTP